LSLKVGSWRKVATRRGRRACQARSTIARTAESKLCTRVQKPSFEKNYIWASFILMPTCLGYNPSKKYFSTVMLNDFSTSITLMAGETNMMEKNRAFVTPTTSGHLRNWP
jgi:hypothetical protein